MPCIKFDGQPCLDVVDLQLSKLPRCLRPIRIHPAGNCKTNICCAGAACGALLRAGGSLGSLGCCKSVSG